MASRNNKARKDGMIRTARGAATGRGAAVAVRDEENNSRRSWAVPKRNETEERAAGQVVIDFPSHGETVTSDRYTLRIGAIGDGHVGISMDGGPWLPCRRRQGYWWFDWSGYAPGRHKAVARLSPASSGIEQEYEVEFLVRFDER